jgi:hypothetical protein
MRIRLKYITPALAAGAAAVAIVAAPTAAAASNQSCIDLGSAASKCQSPGNAQINDSLPYADVLPQWSYFGGQSGGPFGGPGGGGG